MLPSGLSSIFLKWTSTAALPILPTSDELWISWCNLLSLIQLALNPKMKSMLSIRFDFPDPLGPTMEVKFLWNGPIFWVPAYDLKFFKTKWSMIRRGLFYFISTKVRVKITELLFGNEEFGFEMLDDRLGKVWWVCFGLGAALCIWGGIFLNNGWFFLVDQWLVLGLVFGVVWVEFIEMVEVGLTVTLLGVAHLLESIRCYRQILIITLQNIKFVLNRFALFIFHFVNRYIGFRILIKEKNIKISHYTIETKYEMNGEQMENHQGFRDMIWNLSMSL